MAFDPLETLQSLREEAESKRKHRYCGSRLDRYSHEIILLRQEGAKAVEVQTWLRKQRLKVSLSTVTRWLDKHEN